MLWPLTAEAVDGGSDAPLEPTVVRIRRAELCAAGADGGCVPSGEWIEQEGWRVSRAHMQLLGTTVVDLRNEAAAARQAQMAAEAQPPSLSAGAVVAASAIGFVVGVAAGVWVVLKLQR